MKDLIKWLFIVLCMGRSIFAAVALPGLGLPEGVVANVAKSTVSPAVQVPAPVESAVVTPQPVVSIQPSVSTQQVTTNQGAAAPITMAPAATETISPIMEIKPTVSNTSTSPVSPVVTPNNSIQTSAVTTPMISSPVAPVNVTQASPSVISQDQSTTKSLTSSTTPIVTPGTTIAPVASTIASTTPIVQNTANSDQSVTSQTSTEPAKVEDHEKPVYPASLHYEGPKAVVPMPGSTTDQPVDANHEEQHTTITQQLPEKSTPKPEEAEAPFVPSEAEKDEKTEEDNVLDTIDAKSGNWLLKRVYWENIEELYEQIKEVVSQIMKVRTDFFSQRNDLDKQLDIFYGEIGVEQGPLQDLIQHALDLMESEKTEAGKLSPKEKAFVAKLQKKKKDLEQLQLDVKALHELDDKLNEAIDIVLKQIDTGEQYERQAWSNFKDVARELDDKEARQKYYETKGLLDDVNKVLDYLNGKFKQYFSDMIQSAKNHSQKISAQMHSFKSENVDLKKESEALLMEDAEPVKKEAQEVQEPEGWIAKIVHPFKVVWQTCSDFICSLWQTLFGSSETKEDLPKPVVLTLEQPTHESKEDELVVPKILNTHIPQSQNEELMHPSVAETVKNKPLHVPSASIPARNSHQVDHSKTQPKPMLMESTPRAVSQKLIVPTTNSSVDETVPKTDSPHGEFHSYAVNNVEEFANEFNF